MENPAQPCGLWLKEVLPCSSSERREVTSSTRRGYQTCCALRSRMQWLFTLRGAPFIGRKTGRFVTETQSIQRSHRFTEARAYACFKCKRVFQVPVDRAGKGWCMHGVCHDLSRDLPFSPSLHKGSKGVKGRQRFPLNGGLAWWKQGEGCSEVSFPH